MRLQQVVWLTYAEARVLRALMRGNTLPASLAVELFSTENTIKTHLKHILKKSGCCDRVSLVLAIERGRIVIRQARTKYDRDRAVELELHRQSAQRLLA